MHHKKKETVSHNYYVFFKTEQNSHYNTILKDELNLNYKICCFSLENSVLKIALNSKLYFIMVPILKYLQRSIVTEFNILF